MLLANWIAIQFPTWKWSDLFAPQNGPVQLADDGQGHVTITKWDEARLGMAQPNAWAILQIPTMPEAQSIEVLTNYSLAKYASVLAAGTLIPVTTDTGTVQILCDGSAETKTDINGLYADTLRAPSSTIYWTDNNEVTTPLTSAQFQAFAVSALAWMANVFAFRVQTIAQCKAQSITLTSQIDALNWPTL